MYSSPEQHPFARAVARRTIVAFTACKTLVGLDLVTLQQLMHKRLLLDAAVAAVHD